MRTPYFDYLIDDFGIWQHTDGDNILTNEGYALDDAARGLLACLALNKNNLAESLFIYIKNSRHKDSFYGFATKERSFIRFPASDDATGQAVWAMGYSISKDLHPKEAKRIISDIMPRVMDFQHFRGYAYALLGAVYVDRRVAKNLVQKLMEFFKDSRADWLWPEEVMTYGNGIIPYAFIRYGLIAHDDEIAKFGLRVLEFVQDHCQKDRLLGPIGNDGWLPKNAASVPEYSQQPIDTAYMIWAWLAAYQYFGKQQYLDLAKKWEEWFEGENIKATRMYDPKTLKCFDGIDRESVHYHSGAESNICLLLSLHMLKVKNTL